MYYERYKNEKKMKKFAISLGANIYDKTIPIIIGNE